MYLKYFVLSILFTCVSAAVVARDRSGHAEPFFYKGFDLSSLKIEEDGGTVYKDTLRGNITSPVEDMLVGMNTVRVRLWVHPTQVPYDGGYYETYNLQYVMALAKRFHSKGYRIYLDYRQSIRSVLRSCLLTQNQISAIVSYSSYPARIG